jgi:exodeoxyribonuclease VII large subunit
MVPFSVSDLNRMIHEWLDQNEDLAQVAVAGEVSEFKRYPSGHCYFSLKDERAVIRAVMWRSAAERQRSLPKSGDAVFVLGRIDFYETRGDIQLIAEQIVPAGLGLLEQQQQLLRERLAAEGLFDARRKRPIPARPRRIGVVTSAAGAAWQDIQIVIQRRCPLVEVVLAPCQVQGEAAAASVAAAVQSLQREPLDVIIVARGGGSIEDLSAFQTEQVVRAVAASAIPVISGVGHETDTTLVDEAADLRAATPSAAAELATPDTAELQEELSRAAARLQQLAVLGLNNRRTLLQLAQARLRRHDPLRRLENERRRLDELLPRISVGLQARLRYERSRLDGLRARLEALNPLNVLARGYAVVRRRDGRVVSSAAEPAVGEVLEIRLQDGTLTVQVQPNQEAA